MVFEDFIKEIEKVKGDVVLTPIDSDERGYIDKQCSSKNCEFVFKINERDWSNFVQDEAVWCPLCGHCAPADEWFTTEQIEHAEKQAFDILR